MSVSERRVDHAMIRKSEDQLLDADSRKQSVLRKDALVGGVVEVEEVLQVRVIRREPGEHAIKTGAVLREDQPMRVVLPNQVDRRNFNLSGHRVTAEWCASRECRRASCIRVAAFLRRYGWYSGGLPTRRPAFRR